MTTQLSCSNLVPRVAYVLEIKHKVERGWTQTGSDEDLQGTIWGWWITVMMLMGLMMEMWPDATLGYVSLCVDSYVSWKHTVFPLKTSFLFLFFHCMEVCYAWENMLYSMHEIYFSESREMVRILSVLHTYLDITSGDKINENLTC